VLYVTTRNEKEHYTPAYPLRNSRSIDGGFYVPHHVPEFTPEEVLKMLDMPFGQCVAQIINKLFCTQLTGWDIDFAIGRYPVRLQQFGHRIWIAETWHNIDWDFQYIVSKILMLIDKDCNYPSAWVKTSVRAAVLFGIYSELRYPDLQLIDVAVVSQDFTLPMSVWYARSWGLPVGNIICCIDEEDEFWNLISYGRMRLEKPCNEKTDYPEAIEELIYACGGSMETNYFLECQRNSQIYIPSSNIIRDKIQQGMVASVVSKKRIMDTIPAVLRTNGYLLDPITSWAYSGFMDYRANTGIIRPSVVISEKSPIYSLDVISKASGLTYEKIKEIADL